MIPTPLQFFFTFILFQISLVQESWCSLFLLTAFQWKIVSNEWLYDYARRHKDQYDHRDLKAIKDLADLFIDMDQIDIDLKELACLQFIALFNPCKST